MYRGPKLHLCPRSAQRSMAREGRRVRVPSLLPGSLPAFFGSRQAPSNLSNASAATHCQRGERSWGAVGQGVMQVAQMHPLGQFATGTLRHRSLQGTLLGCRSQDAQALGAPPNHVGDLSRKSGSCGRFCCWHPSPGRWGSTLIAQSACCVRVLGPVEAAGGVGLGTCPVHCQ